MSKSKNTLLYFEGCKFFVNTNNLVSSCMLNPIIGKFNNDAISRLNEVIKGIKFLVGGKQWHQDQKGYLKGSVYEYDLNQSVILVFLSKIFNKGYERWRRLSYGSLKRFIWESFCYEFTRILSHITKIDLRLVDKAKNLYLNIMEPYSSDFSINLFNYERNNLPRINYLKIINSIWSESLPEDLGFLNVLYARKLSHLKKNLANIPYYMRLKYFNELRKLKLNYEFEYNLSELINYCIHNEHFEKLFSHSGFYSKLQKEFYNKAKRIILKFFKQYHISDELYPYIDSAHRTHYFISHSTFERIKSVCLQICIAKIKNQHLEQYTKFEEFYSECPICKQKQSTHITCQQIFFNSKYSFFKDILLKKMNEYESLNVLNSHDCYFGVPCDSCFQLTQNIRGKFSELNVLQKFIIKYDTCPVCGQKNHMNYLINFFNDSSKKLIRDFLINYMDLPKRSKKFNINIGIPCCSCFDQFFGEESNIGHLDIACLEREL